MIALAKNAFMRCLHFGNFNIFSLALLSLQAAPRNQKMTQHRAMFVKMLKEWDFIKLILLRYLIINYQLSIINCLTIN